MRKWKDSENSLLPKKVKTLMLIMAIPGLIFLPLDILLYHNLSYGDIFDLFAASFLIWGLKYNGIYKIVRFLKERELRKKDNNWRNS